MTLMGKPYTKDGPSAEDKALDLFSELMIERIQSLSGKDSWKKPWFTDGALQWPKNLNGREYNGQNALMLLLHCEKEGYKIPRFCTFDCIQRMNSKDNKGEDDKPRVSVLKGEHSFPVMLTTFTCVHKETKERIKWDDYKRLSQDEQEKYNVYPKMQVFRVFNVQQTNLKEARPELWQKLEQEYSTPVAEKGEQYAFEPVDRMITDNRWICPIKPTYGDSAYYSISKNEIVVPEKPQFMDGESFYGTAFHEMAHSTGAEGQLNRINPSAFGSAEYAREELVAELTAALTAQRYGMTKNLKDDSAAYLKSWLDSLKESPQFIKTTLLDVKKAASMLTQHIDKMAVEIENEKKAAQTEEIKNDNGTKDNKNTGQVYYASVAYLQSADDTSKFDELKEKGDEKGILALAREYYDGNGMDEEQTYKSACKERGDFLLTEDNEFAVVFNGIISGTYEIYLKHTEQEVRDHIIRYGIGRASEDVKEVAREMVAEDFSEMERRKLPVFQMPDGGLLNLQYDKVRDNLDVGTVTNAGFSVMHSFQYNHDNSLEMNIQEVYRQLLEMPEYRQKDEEQEEHVAKSAFRR